MFENLHDSTLIKGAFDWPAGILLIVLDTTEDFARPSQTTIECAGFRSAEFPRLHPWFDSDDIDSISEPEPVEGGYLRISISLQGGDTLTVIAGAFSVVKQDVSNEDR